MWFWSGVCLRDILEMNWGAIKVEESFTLYYFNDVPITLFHVEKSND